FDGAVDATLDQNFEQNFETFGLELQTFDAVPPDHEKSRQRIFDAQVSSLQRRGCACATTRDQKTKLAPFIHAVAVASGVATCNGDIVSLQHGFEKFGQHFRRMLQVRINHAQKVCVGLSPAVDHCSRQSSMSFADKHTDSGILL